MPPVTAPTRRATSARSRLEPQLGKALALELMAEERANARAREPDAPLLPGLRVEHEHIG